MSVLVSIIVPCYNCDGFVRDTLESIRAQTYKNIECVMVDDMSTDRTLDILKDFARKDSRFRVVTHRMNSGLGAARNSGARASLGDLLCFLDSDDLMMTTSVERRVEAFFSQTNRREQIAGSYCGSVTIQEDTKKVPSESENKKVRDVDFLTSMGACPFNANQPMIRSDVFWRMGGFNEELRQAEDYELWTRLLRAGYRFVAAPWNAVTYRAREGSMVRRAPLLHLDISTKLHRSFYAGMPEDSAYSISPFFFSKPGAEYMRQRHFFNRACEFVGMFLAVEENTQEAIDVLAATLPDVHGLFDEEDLHERLMVGIKRVCANDTQLAMEKEFLAIGVVEGLRDKRSGADGDTSQHMSPADMDESPFGLLWKPREQGSFDILFFPHKDYHVWTISLLMDSLKACGLRFGVVDFSMHHRDERVRSKAEELGIELISFGNFCLGEYRPRLIVSFNDWDPFVRSLFHCAFDAGVQTAAIVEGIQDYHDADTGRLREPYLCADTVIVTGRHDEKYFTADQQKIRVGGVPRILELMELAPSASGQNSNTRKVALINSNFSYGVLTDERDAWLTSAVEATRAAGWEPVISRHPADVGTLYPEFVSKDSFYDLLERSDLTIQRFASGILEALAREKPVIYFNPHGEKVDKFKDPQGAFELCNSEAQLVEMLSGEIRFDKKASFEFLDFHCNISDVNMAATISSALADALAASEQDQQDPQSFQRNLRTVSILSNSFSDRSFLSKNFAAIYGVDQLDREIVRKQFDALHSKVNKDSVNKASVGTKRMKPNPDYTPRSSKAARKWAKFKSNPTKFFQDSGVGPMRTIGKLMGTLPASRNSQKMLLREVSNEMLQLRRGIQQAKSDAAGLKREIATLKSASAKSNSEIASIQKAVADKTRLTQLERREVSLDMASALRAISTLWTSAGSAASAAASPDLAHGHQLFMEKLIELEKRKPGALFGKHVVEVGTTRERYLNQGSTEKLAMFTAFLGMHFTTVDMDPENTAHAAEILRHLNPSAEAVTDKGESYLANGEAPLDFVYLDAFDYDHGKHSAVRQQRYVENLGTTITNEACWSAHEACAQALIKRMPPEGIVVFDDTWKDADGKFDGKGKLAVPLLVENGFEIIEEMPTACALRRSN